MIHKHDRLETHWTLGSDKKRCGSLQWAGPTSAGDCGHVYYLMHWAGVDEDDRGRTCRVFTHSLVHPDTCYLVELAMAHCPTTAFRIINGGFNWLEWPILILFFLPALDFLSNQAGEGTN